LQLESPRVRTDHSEHNKVKKTKIRASLAENKIYRHCLHTKRSTARLSFSSFDRSRSVRRVCCRAPGEQEMSIDSGGRRASSSSGAAAQVRSTALSSKCEQCHVDS